MNTIQKRLWKDSNAEMRNINSIIGTAVFHRNLNLWCHRCAISASGCGTRGVIPSTGSGSVRSDRIPGSGAVCAGTGIRSLANSGISISVAGISIIMIVVIVIRGAVSSVGADRINSQRREGEGAGVAGVGLIVYGTGLA